MSEAISLDTSGFNRMIGDLVQIGGPGSNADTALRGEVASLLNVCAQYTPAANVSAIKARADYRFSEKYSLRGTGDLKVTMNDGSRGGEAVAGNVWMRSGGRFYIMRGPGRWPAGDGGKTSRFAPNGAHWPDRIWNQYQSLINQTPEELAKLKRQWEQQALRSRGLAKATWGQIAQALGIEGVMDRLPQYAQRAVGSDGRAYLNGRGTKQTSRTELTYVLSNAMPALVAGGLDGAGIVQRAIATREKAFGIALEKGVFDDIAQVAKRYPGILAV